MDKELIEWTALCEFQYPTDREVAWEGLATVIADGLRGRGPVIRFHPVKHFLLTAFSLEAATRDIAEHEGAALIIGVLGEDAPLTRVSARPSSEIMEQQYSDELSEKRLAKQLAPNRARRFIFNDQLLEQPQNAKIIHLRPRRNTNDDNFPTNQ